LLNNVLHSQTALESKATFDEFSGGTFIYVGSMDTISHTFAERESPQSKYIVITTDYGLMAIPENWG